MYSCIKTANTLEIILNGKSFSVHASHSGYDKVLEALKAKDEIALNAALNHSERIVKNTKGNVEVNGGVVTYKGEEIHGTFVTRLLELIDLGMDTDPIINFIENIMLNPTKHVLDDLYNFLEYGKLPLTSDGHFLAYKVVNSNFKDKYTSSVDNSVGAKPEMARNKVDDNRHNTCSQGFHFCSYEYINFFLSLNGDDRIMLVKVNPADVVSIPKDHNNTKARCCKYEVIDDVTEKMAGTTKETQVLNKPVISDYDNEMKSDKTETLFASIGDREDVSEEDITCGHCGSDNLQSRGTEPRSGGRTVRRYRCNDCGHNTYVEE